MPLAADPCNVMDFEALARDRMEPSAYDYYAGGAEDERTVSDNRAAFGRVRFRPRVLVDVSSVDTGAIVLNERLGLPVLLAPTAFNRLAHPDGELAAARAAAHARTVMVVSTMASTSLEEVAAAVPSPLWFQLYVYRDRELTRDLVQRASTAGYRALVFTVDAPLLGRRERDARNRFVLPVGISARNLETSRSEQARWRQDSSFFDYFHSHMDPSLTWETVTWLRSITPLPILLKGVLAAEDAREAVASGAAGLIVSNHGGRQLDGAIATLDALPDVTDAVAGRIPVLLDGGVRRGTDILKALALGAGAVLIGRPYLWGLAAAGEDGVFRVLEMLRHELRLAMALAGAASVDAVTRSLVSNLT